MKRSSDSAPHKVQFRDHASRKATHDKKLDLLALSPACSPLALPFALILLRWTALLSPRIKIPISLSTGVHSGNDAIKAFLAGATVVQIASVLYEQKVAYLETMIADTAAWLDSHGYDSVDAIRGKLAGNSAAARAALGRVQYIKALTGIG